MSKRKNHLLTLFLLPFLGCQVHSKKAENLPSWNAQMQKVAADLRSLAPFIYSEEKFLNPKNHPTIQTSLSSLSRSVNHFQSLSPKSYPEKDPALHIAIDRMKADIELARLTFLNKDYSFSRNNLKGITQYCFFCHTRRAKTHSLDLDLKPDALKGATALEKSEYYVATRQFENAKKTLESVLFTDKNRLSFAKERALKKLLLLELRTNSDPAGALTALNKYKTGAGLFGFMKPLIEIWQTDLEKWKKNKGRIPSSLKEIEKRIETAEKSKTFSFDEGPSVTYWIASRGLYDLLAQKQSRRDRAKTYFLLARSYEVLRDTGLWHLNEIYYEACIRKLSHSSLSRKCYEHLEDSLIIGYSGSSGFHVPFAVRKHMRSLKTLAWPKKKKL